MTVGCVSLETLGYAYLLLLCALQSTIICRNQVNLQIADKSQHLCYTAVTPAIWLAKLASPN